MSFNKCTWVSVYIDLCRQAPNFNTLAANNKYSAALGFGGEAAVSGGISSSEQGEKDDLAMLSV